MPPHRIPAQPGEWIDRTLPITFKFEGRSYKGYAGDTLSSALWGSGVRLLGRSFKYHRPRGVMSMAAHDANVFVEDSPHVKNRRNNLRGDVLPITAKLDVVACNTKGGVAND
ncbi:MAG: 2Fe-2S iron-sulfur cluster-binding protein, partial [Phycisphaeraceae bacterium]|nr:2Fe-2S iron-sulfur cluster-binding protein [Phycisphaeraceae bacterium]